LVIHIFRIKTCFFSDKRRTIESFFTSSNKKSRNDEEQDESNVLIPILFSPSESETLDPASLAPPSFSTDDQNTNDIISNTSSSSLCTNNQKLFSKFDDRSTFE